MRTIDADAIRIKPEYIHDVCGMTMIRCEDVTRIIAEQDTIDPSPQWIPCKDRLPEEDGYYLISCKSEIVMSCYFGYKDYKDEKSGQMTFHE